MDHRGSWSHRIAVLLGASVVLVTTLVQPGPAAADCAAWCQGSSIPKRDSVYPAHSMPGVDAWHYGLSLRWAPAQHRLHGDETLTFRAARGTRVVRLALGGRMRVSSAQLDGRPVRVSHAKQVLVVHHAVRAGSMHALRIRYAGTLPQAPPLALQRNAVGMYRTRTGDVFTNDEPVGAFHWYAVNDQPSDKAFYDFRLSVPAPQVGVANGRLVARHRVRGQEITRFHLDAPASSYLTTVEFGRYRQTRRPAVHGVPVTLWTPRGDRRALHRARYLPAALRWVERRLGAYPFRSLSVIVVKGYDSGMENQTLVTVGDTAYDTAKDTLVHEVAHQWYGDLVTPRDWRDVWMNEGMATLLQYDWLAQRHHTTLTDVLGQEVPRAQAGWDAFGPPGDYDRYVFAADNVYFPPALMWDQLRRHVGGQAFWSMVRDWPGLATHAGGNATRSAYLSWIRSRLDVPPHFFHDWLLSRHMPAVPGVDGRRTVPRAVVQRNWL